MWLTSKKKKLLYICTIECYPEIFKEYTAGTYYNMDESHSNYTSEGC